MLLACVCVCGCDWDFQWFRWPLPEHPLLRWFSCLKGVGEGRLSSSIFHNCCLGDAYAPKAQIRINGRIMGGNSRAKHGGVHGAGALQASSCACVCGM